MQAWVCAPTRLSPHGLRDTHASLIETHTLTTALETGRRFSGGLTLRFQSEIIVMRRCLLRGRYSYDPG